MKKKNELSTIDAILGLFFILTCPVVAVSVYQMEFDAPLWMYVVFVIATYRMYQLFFANKNRNNFSKKRFEPGDEIETNVVGVTFENRQQLVQKIAVGQSVYLTREADNSHDRNAIKVMANRYTKDEMDALGPKLEEKYGKYSYAEIFGELYAKDSIGYINRELAERISPIFDKYAVKPNHIIDASVVSLTGTENEAYSKGVRIRFKLPTQEDLERAMQREVEFQMETDFRMTHLP